MTEYRPWLSEAHNQIAQLLDILDAIDGDRSINVGYPSDNLREWEKENSETHAWIKRMNMYAHWAHEHYSSLWRDGGPGYTIDADMTLGNGYVPATLEALESVANQIGIETGKIDAIMDREKIRYGNHWEDERVKPTLDARDALFIDFARGSRKLDTDRFRARNKK